MRRLIALVWVGLAGCPQASLPNAAPAHSSDSSAHSFRVVPIGLCEDYPEESRSLDTVRRDMQVLHAAGVTALRLSIGWDGLEPTKDHYDWAFWDAFVDIAVRENGIRLLPYVAYTPRWNATGGPDDYWKSRPIDLGQFAEVMGLLAARYRDTIGSWELWNEPDNHDFWLGGVDGYERLVEAGAAGVRRANPTAHVVAGGIAGHPQFLEELLDSPAGRLVDTVNVHAYFETWNPEPLEHLPDYVGLFRDAVNRHGGGQALWMAEVGYSDYRSPSPAPYEHTPTFQAVVLVRTLALVLALREIALIAWYEVKDPPTSDTMIGDDNNRHLGVTFSDYRPKPALRALRFMSDLFAAGFEAMEATDESVNAIFSRAFRLRDGRAVLIAWLPTRPTSKARVRFSLPVETSGLAGIYSATGDFIGSLPIENARGRSSIDGLELESSDVAVVIVRTHP
ncbi:MAG TPA: beta-galactosidase [Polyangiaceae bacterium]